MSRPPVSPQLLKVAVLKIVTGVIDLLGGRECQARRSRVVGVDMLNRPPVSAGDEEPLRQGGVRQSTPRASNGFHSRAMASSDILIEICLSGQRPVQQNKQNEKKNRKTTPRAGGDRCDIQALDALVKLRDRGKKLTIRPRPRTWVAVRLLLSCNVCNRILIAL